MLLKTLKVGKRITADPFAFGSALSLATVKANKVVWARDARTGWEVRYADDPLSGFPLQQQFLGAARLVKPDGSQLFVGAMAFDEDSGSMPPAPSSPWQPYREVMASSDMATTFTSAWVSMPGGPGGAVRSIRASSTQFRTLVAVGGSSSTGTGIWALAGSGAAAADVRCCAAADATFYMGGLSGSNAAIWSSDGDTLSLLYSVSGTTQGFKGIAYLPRFGFCALEQITSTTFRPHFSADGTSWAAGTTFTASGNQVVGMAAGNRRFLALLNDQSVTPGSRIYSSTDGLSMAAQTSHGIPGEPSSIVFRGKFFVSNYSRTVYSSVHGAGAWKAEALPLPSGYSGGSVNDLC